ncbi:MAG: acyltransferase family protein [Sphingomonas sp.]|jgi:peptidoglycan/LPS O-acetylase OafA/YrhL|uniref:acyltransferase family protein n=1 Tax=Sphingomonas sp. TaxID=28214 RepID=UPI003565A19C
MNDTITNGHKSGSSYIAAIDGLRALAVSAVVLFHLWPAAMPGGFIGVDIFFVISGFVVTGSLTGRRFASLGELSTHFYARRLVRIMPALILMLLVTIVVQMLFVPRSWLSDSIPQVARFAFFGLSNIVLATDTDSYFGPQAGFNPFTHTWSLGVEEQFYLVFPFLLFWHQRLEGARMPTRRVVRLIALLSAASLAIHMILTVLAPKFGFYLIVSRFWELGAGMLLCLTLDRWQGAPGVRHAAMGGIGLALIAAGLLLPFDIGLARNLLGVAGAAALIGHVVARRDAPIAGLFASRILVAMGRRSYALYLWHWPVFVLFRWTTGLNTLPLALAALAISLALAAISYALVEDPIRRSARIAALPRGRVVLGAAVATLLAFGAAQAIFAGHDRLTLSRTGNAQDWYADDRHKLDPARSRCSVVETDRKAGGAVVKVWSAAGCAGTGRTIRVLGDSHATVYTPALRQLVADTGVTVQLWVRAGCPVLRLIDPLPQTATCKRFYDAIFDEVAHNAKPGEIVFLPGLRIDRFANQFDNDRDIRLDDRQASPLGVEQAREFLTRLAQSGVRLKMEAPKPIFPSPPFRCVDWFDRGNPSCAGGISIARSRVEQRRAPIVAAMHRLQTAVPQLELWDPMPLLCPGATCEALVGGRPLFFDGDHLSGHGNDVLYPALKRALLD